MNISSNRPWEPAENPSGCEESTGPEEAPVNDGGGGEETPAAGDSYTDP